MMSSKRAKTVAVALGGLLGLSLVLWVSSERVRYAASAAVDHLQLMASRVPVQSLIDAPDTPPELRAKLETVLRARRFASEELALPDNASYQHYIEVGRPEVGWNVFAAPEFSLEPRRGLRGLSGLLVRGQCAGVRWGVERTGQRCLRSEVHGLFDAGLV